MEISAKRVRSEFVRKVEELSSQKLLACYQCGRCSAGCPSVSAMDILPNQVVRLAQLGLEEEVLGSKSIWFCASCFTCVARCPRGVDLAKIMEALRLILLRRKADHVKPLQLPEETFVEIPQVALVGNFRKFTG